MPSRVLHVCTIPATLTFLRGHLEYLSRHGYVVAVASSPGPELDALRRETGITTFAVPMTRAITPARDMGALLRLVKLCRRFRPDIVHAHTPKAGLLGMLAGFVTQVPHRVYHLRGLRFTGTAGAKRDLLRYLERFTISLSHVTIAVSESLREEAVAEQVVSRRKLRVLANGSGQGVDGEGRFAPTAGRVRGRALRGELGIPEDAVVLGYVGRLSRDKGISELEVAWRLLRAEEPGVWLLVVGDADPADPVDISAVSGGERVRCLSFTKEMASVYEALDVLVLPTYREGFPNVLLEAAAMEVSVVATRVTGCVDAVVDGVTGTLVPAKDASALADGIRRLCRDPELRARQGVAARKRVLRDFRPEAIAAATTEVYESLLEPQRARQAEKVAEA